jgi:hypothetical protein
LPTESVSRDGVWDGIYLVVRFAALEPRAGTPRRARLRWLRSPKAGGANDLNDVRFRGQSGLGLIMVRYLLLTLAVYAAQQSPAVRCAILLPESTGGIGR